MSGICKNVVAIDSDCFDHWHHVTCCHYSTTDFRGSLKLPFRGRVAARQFGPLTISDVSASLSDRQFEITRRLPDIRRDPREHFMLALVARGEIGIAQDDRSARMREGDLVFYDQMRPFAMKFADDAREFVLTIPRALMTPRLPKGSRLTARRIAGSSRLGLLTASIIRYLVEFDAWADNDAANRIGMSALDVLAATFEIEFADVIERRGPYKLRQAKRYVLANLRDPEMTIDSIAAALNVAPRTLHRLFLAEGTTPIRWLWQQRLAASYRALADGHVRRVTDAAFNFGFTDLSHFSRVFKKTFGHAPQHLLRR